MDSQLKSLLEVAETLGGRVQWEVVGALEGYVLFLSHILILSSPPSPLIPPPLLSFLLSSPSLLSEASLLHHGHNVLSHH